jgi:hypothetical protein
MARSTPDCQVVASQHPQEAAKRSEVRTFDGSEKTVKSEELRVKSSRTAAALRLRFEGAQARKLEGESEG